MALLGTGISSAELDEMFRRPMAAGAPTGLVDLPWREPPMCAVCGVRCEAIEEEHNVLTEERTFLVRCHGQTETVRVTTSELRGIRSLEFGEAFKTAALGGVALARR